MIAQKTIFHFLMFLVLLIGCSKPENQNYVEENISVQGVLLAGATSQKIIIEEINSGKRIENAVVKICNHGVCYDLPMVETGVYQTEELIVLPDSTYNLEVIINNKTITSSTKIPGELSWISLDGVIINIDTSNTGQPVLTAQWQSEGDNAFLLTLQNTEENPEIINYPVSPFSFDEVYELPINNTSITLQDLFFNFYGNYEFSVYSIDNNYRDLFFYQPQIQQIRPDAGLDNIDGAFGVFVGANKISASLIVN